LGYENLTVWATEGLVLGLANRRCLLSSIKIGQ